MQAGTVAFCGVGAATMAHNGGKHAWDITPAQAQEASYVSRESPLERRTKYTTTATD